MIQEEEELHQEAEEIRRETAEGAPELAEHDRVGELEKALEEAIAGAAGFRNVIVSSVIG